ncbi:MAG: flagellar hook-length control protein FliK, partial [Proteobacteria bacterium]|nr:flagellar hook-length control protein FliK [Pseudomonadota bacterium]
SPVPGRDAEQRQPAGGLPVAAAQAPAAAVPAAASTLVALMPALPLPQAQDQQESGAQVLAVEPAQAAGEPVPARASGMPPAQVVEYALARFAQAAADAQPQPSALGASPRPAADGAPAAAALIHPQAASLVHQQLDLLASGVFRWSGHAWPGVPMEWTVQEERARQQHGGEPADDQPVQWATTLSLDLPQLGSVKVNLRLSGMNVNAQVLATQADAAHQLRKRDAVLGRRMSDAGLALQSLQFDSQAVAP